MDEMTARARLAEERARVVEELSRLRSEMHMQERDFAGELGDYDQHSADVATELSMRMDDERRMEDLEERLAAIARAERRLDDGTYGRSVESGVPIPDARLEVIPWAERTVAEEAAQATGRAAVVDPGARIPHLEEEFTTPLDEPEEEELEPEGEELPAAAGPADVVGPEGEMSPEEQDDEVDMEAPGVLYHGEGGPPEVGEDEEDDEALRRTYRPD
jgi:DnaK suppressor protein